MNCEYVLSSSADSTTLKESCFAYAVSRRSLSMQKLRFLTESEKVTVVWQMDKDAGASWSFGEFMALRVMIDDYNSNSAIE